MAAIGFTYAQQMLYPVLFQISGCPAGQFLVHETTSYPGLLRLLVHEMILATVNPNFSTSLQ
jgi:uncharacterized membrane protein